MTCFHPYLRSSGLSFSVKKVTAFPMWPALPVRPDNGQKHTFKKNNNTHITSVIP